MNANKMMYRSPFFIATLLLVAGSAVSCLADGTTTKPKTDPFKSRIAGYFRLPGGIKLNPQQQRLYDAFCDSIEPDLHDVLKRLQETKKQPTEWAAASRQLRKMREQIRNTQDLIVSGQYAPAAQYGTSAARSRQSAAPSRGRGRLRRPRQYGNYWAVRAAFRPAAQSCAKAVVTQRAASCSPFSPNRPTRYRAPDGWSRRIRRQS